MILTFQKIQHKYRNIIGKKRNNLTTKVQQR